MYLLLTAVIVIYTLLHVYYTRRPSPRHLTNEHNFAHFSKITDTNKWFFPQFLLATPHKYTVCAGEALWIPKGWWHWVKSEPGTMAFSYWCSEKEGPASPYRFLIEVGDAPAKIDSVLSEIDIDVWDSSNDKFKVAHIESAPKRCIITLPGYMTDLNKNLHQHLKEYMKKPPIPSWEGCHVEGNIWIALGSHDTGLHYDDNNGILHVLRGKKEILLYPPSQSHLLASRCVISQWAKQTPWYIKYNTNEIVRPLKNSFPSARLLYESAINNKSVLKDITERVKNNRTYIWGCKWQDGVMRWELYIYHFDKSDEVLKTYDADILTKKNPEPLVITSFDLYNPLGDTKHRYYANTHIGIPFWGYGTQGETEEHESVFVLDQTHNFILRFKEYMDQLGFENIIDPNILYTYKSDQMCIANKKPGEIFVQYLGISIDDFTVFLIENDYPSQLVTHVMENRDMYEQIRHEVTIVYDIKTMRRVRSGFYGST